MVDPPISTGLNDFSVFSNFTFRLGGFESAKNFEDVLVCLGDSVHWKSCSVPVKTEHSGAIDTMSGVLREKCSLVEVTWKCLGHKSKLQVLQCQTKCCS